MAGHSARMGREEVRTGYWWRMDLKEVGCGGGGVWFMIGRGDGLL